DRQIVAMGERIRRVMMRRTKAQPLVVGNRPRYVRDHEDRLHANNASHAEIIGVDAHPSSDLSLYRHGTFLNLLSTVLCSSSQVADLVGSFAAPHPAGHRDARQPVRRSHPRSSRSSRFVSNIAAVPSSAQSAPSAPLW